MRHARGVEQMGERRFLIRDVARPRDVKIAEFPGVLERCARGFAADGGGVVAVGVERRIEIDQIDCLAVEAAQYVEVVARPDRAVGPVRSCRGGGVSAAIATATARRDDQQCGGLSRQPSMAQSHSLCQNRPCRTLGLGTVSVPVLSGR